MPLPVTATSPGFGWTQFRCRHAQRLCLRTTSRAFSGSRTACRRWAGRAGGSPPGNRPVRIPPVHQLQNKTAGVSCSAKCHEFDAYAYQNFLTRSLRCTKSHARPPARPPAFSTGWNGTLEATSQPNPCVQWKAHGTRAQSEDCLGLNVFTAQPANGSRRDNAAAGAPKGGGGADGLLPV